jgi:purine-nucleoside phosphorylase
VQEAAAALRRAGLAPPTIGIVLGSGLGHAAGLMEQPESIRYEDLPHWPASRVVGHEGRAVLGRIGGRPAIVLSGRCHAYEGHTMAAVTFGIRVLGVLGVRVLILTNAAGGVNSAFEPGDLMAIDDHINLMGANPLAGANDERFGPRFCDMSTVYSPRLRELADDAAREIGRRLVHGVYAAMTGPSYETPAEIRYLRAIGADAVGMSTVPEAMVARHMGLDVLGLSCISNMAAGVSPRPLDHADVIETTGRAGEGVSLLLNGIVRRL